MSNLVCLRSYRTAVLKYRYLTDLNPHYRYNFKAIYRDTIRKNKETAFEHSRQFEETVLELKLDWKKVGHSPPHLEHD